MYASSATHFSITKAAALLGIGRENVRQVAVDERFRMRVDDLLAKITADLDAGYIPFCVVGNAGTVDTGAVDPLAEIRELAKHTDGDPPYTYSDLTDRIARLALRRACKSDQPFGVGSLLAAIAEVAPTPLMSRSLD